MISLARKRAQSSFKASHLQKEKLREGDANPFFPKALGESFRLFERWRRSSEKHKPELQQAPHVVLIETVNFFFANLLLFLFLYPIFFYHRSMICMYVTAKLKIGEQQVMRDEITTTKQTQNCYIRKPHCYCQKRQPSLLSFCIL